MTILTPASKIRSFNPFGNQNPLPISTNESGSDFPESSDPLPSFVVPWDVENPIQTDVDEPAVPTVPDPVEPFVPSQQHQLVAFPEPAPAVKTRSGRRICRPLLFEAAHANCAFLHNFSPDKPDESFALRQKEKCSAEPHHFAFAAESGIYMAVSSDPDTMTLIEALKQPDCHELIKEKEKELRDHIDIKHWKVVPFKSIPVGKHAITMV